MLFFVISLIYISSVSFFLKYERVVKIYHQQVILSLSNKNLTLAIKVG